MDDARTDAGLPAPLVPADCDCTDLDGFMLNVERLQSSELVALATPEELAAALMLWCRAWKQVPAASLPADDRVLAAFARSTPARSATRAAASTATITPTGSTSTCTTPR